MKQNLEHVIHAVIITIVIYFAMIYILKQSQDKACSRSSLLGALALAYMIMFGHSFPPVKLNPSLGF